MNMEINVKATNLELTAPLQEYIEEKIGSLEKFLVKPGGAKEAHFTAWVEVARTTRHHHKGDVYYAECDIKLKGKMLRATDENFDIRVAIDAVRDKLQREIKKYKARKI